MNCHQIAHMIGAGGLLHFEGNVGKAFAEGNSTCGSGYYHGLLQWKLAGVRASQVAGIAREVCNDPEIKANGFNYYQCDHGLGHGLMLYTAYDLPQALRFCHKLETNFDQTSCTGGVFMENLSSSFGVKTNWLDKKNLLYPCNSKVVSESDKTYCYTIVAERILPAVGYDWKKTADWCRRSEPGWADECFQSFGRSVASATRSTGRDHDRRRRRPDANALPQGRKRRAGLHHRSSGRRAEQQPLRPDRQGRLRQRQQRVPGHLLPDDRLHGRPPASRRGRQAGSVPAVRDQRRRLRAVPEPGPRGRAPT